MEGLKLLIDGKLVAGDQTMRVLNPATEEVLAECPRGTLAQLNSAVAAAKAAFPKWSKTEIGQRRKIVGQIAGRIEENAPELARILTQESGKPLGDASFEINRVVAIFRYFATLDLATKVIEDSSERKVELHRRPLGVVGAITPWNFPMLMLSFKVPPALMAGNTLVVKPAPTTPLGTLRFGELIADLLPPGVLNIVTDANDLGDAMTSHPDISKIAFTGSSATGRKVMASAAGTLKRITLELGGNDAGIVLDDVNPKAIAPAIFDGAFANNGQSCLALKRLYVHEGIYDEMCAELVEIANNAVVDDGLKQGTKLGPLQNKMQFEKVKGYLDDAKANGRIVAGGDVPDRPGYFIRPTIVRDIVDGTKLVDEEQFGPILPVIKFSDPEETIRRVNSSAYGLGGSIWSSNLERAHELATQMDSGTVWVNKHLNILPHVPFGGARGSGIGSELGEDALAEFTQLHVINMAR